MNCESLQERLSAYLDREIDARQRMDVARHLDACAACRSEHEALVALRHVAEREFARELSSAPAVPAELSKKLGAAIARHSIRRRKTMFRVTGVGIAAALVLVAIILYPTTRMEALPAELVRRASARYLELLDAEILLSFESEAIELIEKFLGKPPKSVPASSHQEPAKSEAGSGKTQRVLIKSPNRFLFLEGARSGTEPGVPTPAWDATCGFDGKTAWSFNAETDTMTLSAAPKLDLRHARLELGAHDFGDAGLVEFLSWGFVREMNRAGRDLTIREVTGPYERRVGHRAFVFDLREPAQGEAETPEGRILEIRVRVVIDPRSDLIEKAEFDINLGGLSLVTLRAELAAANPGLAEEIFDYRRYAGPATRVVTDERSRAEGQQK